MGPLALGKPVHFWDASGPKDAQAQEVAQQGALTAAALAADCVQACSYGLCSYGLHNCWLYTYGALAEAVLAADCVQACYGDERYDCCYS